MCRLAGIKCESIIGVSKSIGFYPGATDYLLEQGRHSWNRVMIKGQWFFCDAAWAAGVSSKDNYNPTFGPAMNAPAEFCKF